MKKYVNGFFKEEDGIETIEFVALIAVAAVLIAVIVNIGTRMQTTANKASTVINSKMGKVDSLMG